MNSLQLLHRLVKLLEQSGGLQTDIIFSQFVIFLQSINNNHNKNKNKTKRKNSKNINKKMAI